MINEYLFSTDEHREKIEAYKPAGITIKITNIKNSALWVASYSIDGDSEENAKKLSEVHTFVYDYSSTVLACGSAKYYNKMLYPLANDLERKLRRLLYLAVSISNDKNAKEQISELEEKDFGTIFDILFIDQNFIVDLKKRVNADNKSEFNGKSRYSKDEIQNYLDSLEEKTLWDDVVGKDKVSALRNNFRDVNEYRNDIMHAHNIDEERYKKAKALFKKVNSELDEAIDKYIEDLSEKTIEQKAEMATKISTAVTANDASLAADLLKNISPTIALDFSSQVSELLKDMYPAPGVNAAVSNLSKQIAEITKGIDTSAITTAARQAAIFQESPAIQAVREQVKQFNDIMKPYQAAVDALKPYAALQQSLGAIAGIKHNNELLAETGDEDDLDSKDDDINHKKPEDDENNE